MSDISTVIHHYIAAWNEADPSRRREFVRVTFADDATYLDPLMSSEGHEGIDAMIAGAQQQFPGHRFELAMGPDAHNDRVRFGWALVGPGGGDPVAGGVDFATVADDGRLQAVTGFLEPGA